jgi:hypothetical protein
MKPAYAPDPQLELKPDGTAVLLIPRRGKVDRLRPNRSEERHARFMNINPGRNFESAPERGKWVPIALDMCSVNT